MVLNNQTTSQNRIQSQHPARNSRRNNRLCKYQHQTWETRCDLMCTLGTEVIKVATDQQESTLYRGGHKHKVAPLATDVQTLEENKQPAVSGVSWAETCRTSSLLNMQVWGTVFSTVDTDATTREPRRTPMPPCRVVRFDQNIGFGFVLIQLFEQLEKERVTHNKRKEKHVQKTKQKAFHE